MAEKFNPNAAKEKAEHNKAMLVQSAKIIAVLVAICLVCTFLLAVAKDLFFVSDEEKFNRSMEKIYPGFKLDKTIEVTTDACAPDYGKTLGVSKAADGGYVIETLGNGGFNNGTVTLYVAMTADGRIKGWAIKDSVGQSFISKITTKHQQTWYVALDSVDVSDIEHYDFNNNKAVGATYTSTAINHAVNMAVHYFRHHLATESQSSACNNDNGGRA